MYKYKVGDKVCFKDEIQKRDYIKNISHDFKDVIYGVVLSNDGDVIRLNWINHKGIVIIKNVYVYCYRLKRFLN